MGKQIESGLLERTIHQIKLSLCDMVMTERDDPLWDRNRARRAKLEVLLTVLEHCQSQEPRTPPKRKGRGR